MDWRVVVALQIFCASVICPVLLKRVVGLPGRASRIFWQFLFNALIAFLVLFFTGEPLWSPFSLLIAGIAMLNPVAYYALWRALDISQSKNALLSPTGTIIAMVLSMIFLGEWKVLTYQLVSGVVLSFAAIYLLAAAHSEGHESRASFVALVRWAIIYSTIWGGISFFMKVLASDHIPTGTFIFYYYFGSFLGSFPMLFKLHEERSVLSASHLGAMFFLAAFVGASLYLAYWAYALAPYVVVQPIMQVSNVIGTMVSGLFFFGERQHLGRADIVGLIIGAAGAIVIACAY